MLARSTLYALALAAGYGVLAASYIVVSGNLAADLAASKTELQRIETTKGIVFVTVTTLAIFAGAWLAMRRITRDADSLLLHERALVASQSKAFAGVLAASVAHDANNVLTAVMADVDGVASGAEVERQQHVAQLRASVERLIALNRRLLLFARDGLPKEPQVADLARVVRDAVATVRAHRSLFGRRVACGGEPTLTVATQPLLVHQIVSNLVLNAGEATEKGGRIEVVVAASGGHVSIEVHDDGPGIPAERQRSLFDSLSTTKEHGHGLGLFSARACAQALGGEIEAGSSHLGGAMLRVRLPRGGAS